MDSGVVGIVVVGIVIVVVVNDCLPLVDMQVRVVNGEALEPGELSADVVGDLGAVAGVLVVIGGFVSGVRQEELLEGCGVVLAEAADDLGHLDALMAHAAPVSPLEAAEGGGVPEQAVQAAESYVAVGQLEGGESREAGADAGEATGIRDVEGGEVGEAPKQAVVSVVGEVGPGPGPAAADVEVGDLREGEAAAEIPAVAVVAAEEELKVASRLLGADELDPSQVGGVDEEPDDEDVVARVPGVPNVVGQQVPQAGLEPGPAVKVPTTREDVPDIKAPDQTRQLTGVGREGNGTVEGA